MPTTFETAPLLPTPHQQQTKRPLRGFRKFFTTLALLFVLLFAIIVISQIIFKLVTEDVYFSDPPAPTDLSNMPLVYNLRWKSNWITNGHRPYTFSIINVDTKSEKPLGELKTATGWSWWWWKHSSVMDLWEISQSTLSLKDSEPSLSTHSVRTWVQSSWGRPQFNILFGRFNAAGQPSSPGQDDHIERLQRCSYTLQPHTIHDGFNLVRQCFGENEQTVVAVVSELDVFSVMTFYSPSNISKIIAYADGRNLWDWKRKWDITISAEADFPGAVVGCAVAMADTWNEQQNERRDDDRNRAPGN